MRPLRIVHISDLHERAPFPGMPSERHDLLDVDAAERGQVLGRKFLEDLSTIAEREVDIVAFTGDLADWGHPAEYRAATDRLRLILAALRVPVSRFFAIPGNHDVQRSVAADAWAGVRNWHAQTRNTRALGRWFRGVARPPVGTRPEWRDGVLSRTAAFWDWLSEFGRADLRPSGARRLGYRHTFTNGAFPGIETAVHIVGLDSAWLCGDENDAKNILLTQEQVLAHTRVKESVLPGLRIVLVHHPLDHLADHDDVRRTLSEDCDLVLHGHQHDPSSFLHNEPGAALRIIASGCLMEGDMGRDFPNGFQLIEVDRPRQRLSIHFRKWSSRGRFWTSGSDIYPQASDGTLTIAMSPVTSQDAGASETEKLTHSETARAARSISVWFIEQNGGIKALVEMWSLDATAPLGPVEFEIIGQGAVPTVRQHGCAQCTLTSDSAVVVVAREGSRPPIQIDLAALPNAPPNWARLSP